MSGIFDEERMLESLKKYLPGGETLTAGIHGIGAETEIKQVFGKCRLVEEIGRASCRERVSINV